MKRGLGLLTLALLATFHATTARAESRGHHVEVRARALGGEAVWVDGRPRWPQATDSSTPTISGLSWSQDGDALAFVARDRSGATLVVTLVDDGVSMTWPLPASAPVKVVTWIGDGRIAAGASELQPALIASFSRE